MMKSINLVVVFVVLFFGVDCEGGISEVLIGGGSKGRKLEEDLVDSGVVKSSAPGESKIPRVSVAFEETKETTQELPAVSEVYSLRETFKDAIFVDAGNGVDDLDVETCTSWENEEPKSDLSQYLEQVEASWEKRKICKLFVTFESGVKSVCTGSLIGKNQLLTARHCTWDACNKKEAIKVDVACGYGYAEVDDKAIDDFALFGTAKATSCIRYEEYDTETECNSVKRKYDIQICRLDTDMSNFGSFGLTTEASSTTNVDGYPGKVDGLTMPNHFEKLYHSFYNVDLTSDAELAILGKGSYLVGGQSGSPYYIYDAETSTDWVQAVHSGGASGCQEYGRKITSNWIDIHNAQLEKWELPAPTCQVAQLHFDYFDQYTVPIKGLGRESPEYAETTVFLGTTFSARLSLFNVGNLATPDDGIFVYFYASSTEGELGKFLYGTSFPSIEEYSTKSFTTSVIPAPADAGEYTIHAVFSVPGCKMEANRVTIGKLIVLDEYGYEYVLDDDVTEDPSLRATAVEGQNGATETPKDDEEELGEVMQLVLTIAAISSASVGFLALVFAVYKIKTRTTYLVGVTEEAPSPASVLDNSTNPHINNQQGVELQQKSSENPMHQEQV